MLIFLAVTVIAGQVSDADSDQGESADVTAHQFCPEEATGSGSLV